MDTEITLELLCLNGLVQSGSIGIVYAINSLARFYFLAIVNNASMYKFLLGIYLGMELLGYTVTKFNPMLRNYQTIFQSDFFTFPTVLYEDSNFSTSLLALVIVFLIVDTLDFATLKAKYMVVKTPTLL